MQSATQPVWRIVLAEDNPADVMLVRMALRQADITCELIVLEDGEDAINFIEKLDAGAGAGMDLLLLDLNLPRLDGSEVLRRLRSSKTLAQTPVIVMTASEDPRNSEELPHQPSTHHFRKSPSFADYMQLGSVVRQALL